MNPNRSELKSSQDGGFQNVRYVAMPAAKPGRTLLLHCGGRSSVVLVPVELIHVPGEMEAVSGKRLFQNACNVSSFLRMWRAKRKIVVQLVKERKAIRAKVKTEPAWGRINCLKRLFLIG
jgi:hypothetical protein